jgi:hypothetical protein
LLMTGLASALSASQKFAAISDTMAAIHRR